MTSFELKDESLYLPVSPYSLEKKNKRVIILITESKAVDTEGERLPKKSSSETTPTSGIIYSDALAEILKKLERNSSVAKPTQTEKKHQEKSPDVNKSSLFKESDQ